MAAQVIKRGNYELRISESGRYTFKGPGIRERGQNVPSDNTVRRRYEREYESGKISQTTLVYIGDRGGIIQDLLEGKVPERNYRSQKRGRKILGLEVPKRIDRKGNKVQIYVDDQERENAIRSHWKEEDVLRRLSGEEIDLPSISSFMEAYPRVYRHIVRKNSGQKRSRKNRVSEELRTALNSVYPGLYESISKAHFVRRIKVDEIAQMLEDRLYTSGLLSKNELRSSGDSDDIWLSNQVDSIRKHNLVGRKLSFSKVVAKLIGLDEEQMKQFSAGRHGCVQIAEKLTEAYFVWSHATGLNPLNLKDMAEFHSVGEKVNFTYCGDQKRGRADGRYGDTAVEVKIGVARIHREIIDDILKKYSPGEGYWDFGGPIKESVLFLHMEPRFHEEFNNEITEAGIQIIPRNNFLYGLKELFSHLDGNYRSEIEEATNQNNLEFMIDIYGRISTQKGLSILSRPGLKMQREWSIKMIDNLIEQGRIRLEHG